jgi:two-component system, sensor histidine kinase PdtaS
MEGQESDRAGSRGLAADRSRIWYNRPDMNDFRLESEVRLSADDEALLDKIARDLPITADLSRADLLLYTPTADGRVMIRAQARPRSSATLYPESRVGVTEDEDVLDGFGNMRLRTHRLKTLEVRGASIARLIFPVHNAGGNLIAMLARDAYWLAHERHKRRAKAYQRALLNYVWMVLHGQMAGAEDLSPFREHDGIMYVDADTHIRYMSGICAELYRGLGYRDSLIDRSISDIDTIDYQMAQKATAEHRAFERSVEQDGRLYIRKVLPISAPDLAIRHRLTRRTGSAVPLKNQGVFILIHDATEAVRAQRELESQMSIVREVHHRVKNNLQVIASIMRMEARRASSEETRAALDDSIQRVLSVAVVHEFLSQQGQGTTINLRDVANRVVTQVQQSLLPHDRGITVSFTGPDIWLPAERATQSALIINELVQNAIQHGMESRSEGKIQVELVDSGASVKMVVTDDGVGLGDDFDLATQANLGLQLVQSMVQRDLRGQFSLTSDDKGTRASVTYEK